MTGVAGLILGSAEVPVPGSLFADGLATPLATVTPLLVTIALLHLRPFGMDATELGQQAPPRARAVYAAVVLGLVAVGIASPLLAGSPDLVVVAARNLALLVLVGAVTTALSTRSAAVGVVLACALTVYTFGWAASGALQGWALLLQPAHEVRAAAAGGLAAVGLLLSGVGRFLLSRR